MTTIVIYKISRSGDIGEPGYSVYGEILPSGKKNHRHHHWHDATQGTLIDIIPTAYLTQSVYDFLTTDEIESIRSKVTGIVENEYTKDVIKDLGSCYGIFTEYALDESKIISTGIHITDEPYDTPHDGVDHGETPSGEPGETPPVETPTPPEKDIIDNISGMLGLSRKQVIYAGIIAFVIILIGGMSS